VSPITSEVVPRPETVVETSTVEETPNVAIVTPRQSSDEPITALNVPEKASRGKRRKKEKNPVDEDKTPKHSVFIFWLIFVQ
jgi:hypothetical protein